MVEYVGKTAHLNGMSHLGELFTCHSANLMRGGGGCIKLRVCRLKLLQLLEEHIILIVGYLGGVLVIIFFRVIAKLTSQLLDSFCRVFPYVISHFHCLSPSLF